MKYVIAGTDAVGLALMDEFHKTQTEVILVDDSRAIDEKLPEGTQFSTCDLLDPQAFVDHTHGANGLILTINPGSTRRPINFTALIENFISIASTRQIPLLYIDSMDAYGDNQGIPMSEATPLRPLNSAENLHSQLAQTLLQAGKEKHFPVCIARCCDLYGPRVIDGPLGQALFDSIITGKPARLIGRLDMPHSFLYVRDAARSIIRLLDNEKAWGHIWHIPGPQPITQKQIIDILRNMVTKPISVQTLGSSMIGFKKIFNSELKAVEDILYRFEKPYVVNHSRFATTFGERVTAHEQALFETLEWFKRRAGIERRFGF